MAYATERYVSPTGTDTAGTPGTSGSPWRTIKYALTRISNDTLLICLGPDTQSPTTKIEIARQDVMITSPDRNVIISGLGCPTEPAGFISGSLNAIFDGFTIKDSLDNGFGWWYGSYGTLSNCHILDAQSDGCFVGQHDHASILNCHIKDCAKTGTAGYVHGIYIAQHASYATVEDTIVEGSVKGHGIHENGNSDVPPIHHVGNAFRRNTLRGNHYRAIDIMNSWDWVFENNLCFGNNISGSAQVVGTGSDVDPPSGASGCYGGILANNTIITSNKTTALRLYGDATEVVGTHNCIIINNIIISTNGATALVDNNTDNTIPAGSNYTDTYSDALMNQLFVNAASSVPLDSKNFALRSGAVSVIGKGVRTATDPVAGTKSAPTTDYSGGARPIPNPGGTWDIGAYQYGSGGTSWPYYVIRPSAIETNEWSWTPSADVTILQRDPDAVYGWNSTEYASYMSCGASELDREWLTLENWGATWPNTCYIHNIKVKFRVSASNIAASLGVALTNTTTGVGYLADKTYTTLASGTVEPNDGHYIVNMPAHATPKLCWAEFAVPKLSNGKYNRFTPPQMNLLQLRLSGMNPDIASTIRVYAIEAECRMSNVFWKTKPSIYTPAIA